MRRFLCLLLSVFVVASCWAQVTGATVGTASVPPMIRFSGTLANTQGTVGVLFSLYEEQTGGAPVWQEFQVVSLDTTGHYTAILGSRSATGIPLEVFGGGARWMAAQAEGQPEPLRVLVVSVPYAMKASDAETLGGLPASAFLRADSLTVAQPTAYINSSLVNAAANKIGITAAIVASGATAGSVPLFTDSGGDLGNSVLFQSASGNVGVGTTAPSALLNLVGANPSMRIDNYSDTVGDSPNFNFITARGTATSPGATQSGDNLGQFAAAGYNGSGFPGSRVKVTFMATENWTPTANGTAMSFQTTTNGTTARAERMRIDNTGYVGIGTTTPTALLEVNGTAKFDGPVGFASGQTFPGTSVSISSPDSSITVGGTASAPTVALNTGVANLLYAPISGSTSYAPATGSASYVGTGATGATMTGPLTLPANGLQMTGNQIVTSGGQLGLGAAPNSEALVNIGGSYTQQPGGYVAGLLRLDGTLNSSSSGQSYLRGVMVTPTFNLSQGYANFLTGVELSMANKTGGNVAHSIVGFALDGQPTGAGECSVGFGISVPTQQTSLCNGTYGFYQAGGAQYNYFASNVGVGTPFPSALLEVNGTAKFDGLVTFAAGQTFPGAGGSVSITSPDSSITVGGTTSAPTVALNTGVTNLLYAPISGSTSYAPASGSANYLAKTGGTMTGPLTLPANGLQMTGNQMVTSAGQFGYGTVPSIEALFDIGGSMITPTPTNYGAELLRIDGSVKSSYYGQAYLRGMVVTPNFDLTQGYANYLSGIELNMNTRTGANVAHSIVGFNLDAQPTSAVECSVGFGINVPNQNTSLCNGSYGFYEGAGSQYNYFAANTGIGTPFPSATLEVNGTAKFDGLVTFASGQTFPGAGGSVSITSPDSSITVGGTTSAPTVALNTAFATALYVPKTGGTMTGPLTLPANGLQMAGNQIVTSGGRLGYSISPNIESLVEIGGSMTTPTPASYGAELLRIDGTVKSSAYGQAYLKGIVVAPTFDISGGYANYLSGVELSMAGVVGSSGVHSVVGYQLDAQPTNGIECSVGFGVGVPNQQTSLCNGTYGIYQAGGAQYNYFASNVGIGTPFPTQALTVQGNVQVNGNLNATGTIQSNGAAGAIATLGTPASSSAPCTPPQLMYDSNYVYTCVAANSWRRTASTSF